MSKTIDSKTCYPGSPGFLPGAPETSREAAENVAEAASSRRSAALGYITSRVMYGATADEVAASQGWERYSSRPRLAELNKAGMIVDSGERREGVSGRRQAVWIAAAFATAVEPEQLALFETG
jgi:hypothetical protein